MSGQNDFDFWIGEWRVRHRQREAWLAGCETWREFGGTCAARKLPGGFGNIDENFLDKPGGAYHAVTIRTFDPASATWAIWWHDQRRPHVLEAPVIGAFEGGVGTFYADDTIDGRPVRVRFLWTAGEAPRWEQAFSPDAGQTWETNWIMDFERAA